jgi:hypothetical protein
MINNYKTLLQNLPLHGFADQQKPVIAISNQ